MNWTYIFPIITTSISFLFFFSVTEQYVRKRKPHQLAWSISMFLFFITAGAEAVSLLVGEWIPLVYRFYYLFAAVQVSVMGAGLLYLFTRRAVIHPRNAHFAILIFFSIWFLFSSLFRDRHAIFSYFRIISIVFIISAILYLTLDLIDKVRNNRTNICSSCKRELEGSCESCEFGRIVESYRSNKIALLWQRLFRGDNFSHLFTLIVIAIFGLMNLFVWDSYLNVSLLRTGKEVSGLPWQRDPLDAGEPRALIRLFSPLHTVPGAIALIGGGIYSYIKWQRSIKHATGKYEPKKGVYNLYIAFGAWVLGLGATLSGFGMPTLYISEVISVTFMYYGFLESDTLSKDLFRKLFDLKWVFNPSYRGKIDS